MNLVADAMTNRKCNVKSASRSAKKFSVRRDLRYVWNKTCNGEEKYTPASKFLADAFEIASQKGVDSNNFSVYNWILILDEFSQVLSIINLSTLRYIDSDDAHSRTTSVMLGALAGHINAVRSLVISGFDVHARIINRSVSEHIDLTIHTILNREFCKSYIDAEEHADANRFWHRNISKGKIRNSVKSIIGSLSAEAKQSYEEMAAYIRTEEEMMGAALHPSYLSAAMVIGMGVSHGQGGIGMFGVTDAASTRTLQFLFCRVLELFVLCIREITDFVKSYSNADFPVTTEEIIRRLSFCVNLGLYIGIHQDRLPLSAEESAS